MRSGRHTAAARLVRALGHSDRDGQPHHPEHHTGADDAALVPGGQGLGPVELRLQPLDDGFAQVADLIGGRLPEYLLGRRLLFEQDLAVGHKIHGRVDQRRVTGRDVVAQFGQHPRQALFFRGSRTRQIGVDLVGDGRHVLDDGRIGPAGLHLLHHIGGGQRQVTHGIAQYGVACFEALNAFFLGGNGAQIGVGGVAQPVRQAGSAPDGVRQGLFEAVHPGDELGQGVEVGKGVGAHPGHFDTPLGFELLNPLHGGNGQVMRTGFGLRGHPVESGGSCDESD